MRLTYRLIIFAFCLLLSPLSVQRAEAETTPTTPTKRHFGLGTTLGGGAYLLNPPAEVLPQAIPYLVLPTIEWAWFHSPIQASWSRSFHLFFTPIDALLNLFQRKLGPPLIALRVGAYYTFHAGAGAHRFLIAPGLDGFFAVNGSRSQGGGSLRLRIGYEFLYAKQAFGFLVAIEPIATINRGNLGRSSRNANTAISAGVGLSIGFFAYSNRNQ